MSTVVRVHNQDAAPQIVVPGRAVVEQMGEYFLFVAKDTIMKERASADSAGKKDGGKADKKDADTAQKPEWRAFDSSLPMDPGHSSTPPLNT